MPKISVQRVYDAPEGGGTRILVDRLWPRGMSKAAAHVDVWLRDVAPSDELRRWYGHDPEKWPEFRKRYFAELREKADAVRELRRHSGDGPIVLLYGAREPRYNNAVALKEYLEKRRA